MSRDSDNRNVNSGSVAAALGLAVAVDDIENAGKDTYSYDDTSNNSSSDNDTVDISNNDDKSSIKKDDDTYTKAVSLSEDDVKNGHNQNNDSNSSSDNDAFTKTITNNDSYAKTLSLSDDGAFTKTATDNNTATETGALSDDDILDSYNQGSDVENNHNQDKDNFSEPVTASEDDITGSNNSRDVETLVEMAISDAFNNITGSYSRDDDWLELDHLDLDVLNAIGAGSLSGNGNDAIFNISQVSEMTDNDKLYEPKVENDSWFKQDTYADGGTANGADNLDDRGSFTASADGVASLEAFTQNIVMGANIQYNSVDLSVVGGSSTITDDDIS